MKIVKKQSKQTYVSSKDKKEHHYYNYFLILENGKKVQIKCAFNEDYKTLDAVSFYEK